jgi:PIN domain nuclease of toxin-antitoxin system
VNLLIDTHVFLWWASNPDRLSDRVRRAIADPGNRVIVSAVSAWEIAIKASLGRLGLPEPADRYIASRMDDNSFVPLAFTMEHSLRTASLPDLHRDPFDRALVAQAVVERIPIATADRLVSGYSVEVVW